MTATETLRRMLDERGVDYEVDEEYGEKYPPEQKVTWSCDIAGETMTITARDYCISVHPEEYCLELDFHEVFTPEQAIAATLGPGTCRAVYDEKTTTIRCSECGGSGLTIPRQGQKALRNYCPNCGRKVVSE